MVRYAAPLLLNKPTNLYEYGLPHPTTVPGNSSRIPSGVNCLVNVQLTMLIPDDQYPRLV